MGYYDDYLEHHGILGQKWGVRRFQKEGGGLTPAGKNRYHTDANGDYQKLKKKTSASNTKVSKKKSSSSEEGETTEKKKGLSDKQKKALKVGATVVGTALVTYGGYKLYQLNQKKATNKLASEASALARSVTAEGPKSFSKSVQNSVSKTIKAPSSINNQAASLKWQAAQQTAKRAVSKPVSGAVKAPSSVNNQASSLKWQAAQQTTKRVISSAGQQKFNQASKANDDLVNDLLKKNAAMLAGF